MGKSGPGKSAAPSCSSTTASSTSPKPSPPASSERWSPSQPWDAIFSHTWGSVAVALSAAARGSEGGQCAASQRWVVRRSASCSSLTAMVTGADPRARRARRPATARSHPPGIPGPRNAQAVLVGRRRVEHDGIAVLAQVEGGGSPEHAVARAHAAVPVDADVKRFGDGTSQGSSRRDAARRRTALVGLPSPEVTKHVLAPSTPTATAAGWPSGRSISWANSVGPAPAMWRPRGAACWSSRRERQDRSNTTGSESGDRNAKPSIC